LKDAVISVRIIKEKTVQAVDILNEEIIRCGVVPELSGNKQDSNLTAPYYVSAS
jgi:hypothetical protein